MGTHALILRCLLAVSIAVLMAVPAAPLLFPASRASPPPTTVSPGATSSELSANSLGRAPAQFVPYTEAGRSIPGSEVLGPAPNQLSIPVLITFQFANSSRLATFLADLQSPHSPHYHHYLTAAQFDAAFGQPTSIYNAAVQYLDSAGATQVRTSTERTSISFDVTPAVARSLFHTALDTYSLGPHTFYAPTASPQLPAPIARIVAGVEGLSSYSVLVNHALHNAPVARSGAVREVATHAVSLDGYPSPVMSGGFQYEFGSDFQVAYDQLSLFAEKGYPTNMVAATVLGAGTYLGNPISTPWGNLASGETVGPFVPHDIYDYYNQTLPAGEPHASVTGVPVNGAPLPGPLASFDNTSSNVENTLDLEMLGSTAPGAKIFNVYGPTLSTVNLDDAFNYILNPNASFSDLANVSVISNSWGGTDAFDASWNSSAATAAARGITVLAASGDSGSNPNGVGGGMDPPGQTTFFPASMAFDSYGDVAVGGTTVTLDPTTLQLTSDVVWNQTAAWDSPNPAAGSSGGISAIFPAPAWQNNTSANAEVSGVGRGVPDIAAIANNTIITLTIGGIEYNASNASLGHFFLNLAGTSVACPLTAGMIVDADHVLESLNDSWLGFLDPTLYPLANQQYTLVSGISTPSTGYITTGLYNSPLPTVPFYDITVGRNFADLALTGYDLTTGWGTIDAYNFTMYYTSYLPVNTPGDLSALRANFNLTGLSVTSPGVFYNASIQQNFFVADALGAPIYWIQNVIYVAGAPGAWQMNFTGWVVYPFWGIYPTDTIYEYNFPVTGQTLSTPLNFSIVTTLENTSVPNGQSVQFSFGIPGTTVLSLPIPGGSYILGGLWNNYSWGGNALSNNPYESGMPGSISPQFGIVGGPSGGTATFSSPSAATLQLEFQRFGSTGWNPGATQAFGESIDQTGESAASLLWTLTTPANQSTGTPANWTMSVSAGSNQQGVLEYDPITHIQTTAVTISTSGLPPGASWSFMLDTSQGWVTYSPTLVVQLANGTYLWNAYAPTDYSVTPNHGLFVVTGTPFQVSLAFQVVTYNVTLVALALPVGYTWWANITETPNGPTSPMVYDLHTNQTSLSIQLENSSLAIVFGVQSNWTEQPHQVGLFVFGQPVVYNISFLPPPKFETTFVVEGLPHAAPWVLNLTGQPSGVKSTGVSINLSLANGSYSFTSHTTLAGYFGTSGGFGVDGAAHEVFVSFQPAVYAVTFTESGLPAGSLWAVRITGGPDLSASGTQVNWSAVNGTYQYAVLTEPAGWTAGSASSGAVTINGSGAAVSLTFGQVAYPLSFSMSGLPAGLSWGVAIDGAAPTFTTGSTLTVVLVNGSYTYAVSDPSGWSSTPSSGSVTIAGQGGTVNLVSSQKGGTTGATGLFGLGTWGWLLVALAVLVIVVLIALAFRARRPPPRPSAANPPPRPPENAAPPGPT